MKYLICTTAISLAAFFPVAADAATYTVPAGDSVTACASGAYDTVEVEGSLTVPAGVALSGKANYIGRTCAATLVVESGGTFGVDPSSPFAELSIGDSGGKARIVVRGGTFKNGHMYIRKDTSVDDSGYIDFLEIDGTSTLTCRNFYNYSSTPARTRILSGVTTFTSAGGASYHHYMIGSWVIDVAEGAKVLFHRAYRANEVLTDNANVSLTFTGAGDVEFTGANDNVFSVASGTVFSHSGYIYNTTMPLAFADGVVIGDCVKGFSTTGKVTLRGNVNVGDLIASGKGVFAGPDSGTSVMTLGRNGRDSEISGAAFSPDNTTISLLKTGDGELAVSATTPFLPELDVTGGSVRIKGALSCRKMALSAGTSAVVDGGLWTIDGNQLMQASGATIATVNGGCIILKVGTGDAPAFAPEQTEIDVLEYWVDGVKQPNGTYNLNGISVRAYAYSEDGKTVWTNGSDTATDYAFAAGSEYLGMFFKTPPSSLNLNGDGVTIGSSGIAVNITDAVEPVYSFDLPVVPAVSQTWNFGNASASFRRPIMAARGVTSVPSLTVRSNRELDFAATNSTFEGALSVSGRIVRVSGSYALGVGSAEATITVDRNISPDASIEFSDTVSDRPISVAVNKAEAAGLVFSGTNVFNGCMTFSHYARFGTFAPDSTTYFNGGVFHYDYSTYILGNGATVVYGGESRLMGYAPSRAMVFSPASGAAATVRFDGAVAVQDETTYYVSVPGISVEFGYDYAFSRGRFNTGENTFIDLRGHAQRFTTVGGAGTIVSSDAPAFVEVVTPEGLTETNSLRFAGSAGLKMVGGGTLVAEGASATTGGVEVTSGTLKMAVSWSNATMATVSGNGVLELESAKAFPRSVRLSLSGSGGIGLPEGSVLRVAELQLTDPSTGISTSFTSGTFTAANSYGLVSGGTVVVGKRGVMLIIR